MPIVRVAGDTLKFPDDMSDEEIRAVLAKEYPPTQAAPQAPTLQMGGAPPISSDPPVNEPDMLDRIGSALGGGIKGASEALTAPPEGAITDPYAMGSTPAERTQKALGSVIGGIGEAGGEVLGAAWNALPEGMTKPVEEGFDWLVNTSPVQYAFETAKKLPEGVQERAGDVANMAAMVAPNARISSPTNIGAKLEKLNTPSYTKTRKGKIEQMLGDTSVDELTLDAKGRKMAEVTDWDAQVAEEVAKIPKVSTHGSIVRNRAVIRDEAINLREKLESTIKKRGNPKIDVPGLETRLDDLIEAIPDMPESVFLVGNAGEKAQRLVTRLRDMLAKSDGTALGVLQVRRDFDTWVRKQNGKVFDAENASAVSFAQKLIRDELNNTVDSALPRLNLKASLDKQHKLLTASDKLLNKARRDAESRIGRMFQKIERTLPVTLPRTPGSIGMLVY